MNRIYTPFCLFAFIVFLFGSISSAFAQSDADYWNRFKTKEAKGLVVEAHDILDTLERMATRKHDSLQLFRVHFERAVLLNTYDQQH